MKSDARLIAERIGAATRRFALILENNPTDPSRKANLSLLIQYDMEKSDNPMEAGVKQNDGRAVQELGRRKKTALVAQGRASASLGE